MYSQPIAFVSDFVRSCDCLSSKHDVMAELMKFSYQLHIEPKIFTGVTEVNNQDLIDRDKAILLALWLKRMFMLNVCRI